MIPYSKCVIRRKFGEDNENFLSYFLGIAVDWIGRNIYWLDMRADKIEVAKLDGTHRSVLINTEIDSPRALQLDPRVGYGRL